MEGLLIESAALLLLFIFVLLVVKAKLFQVDFLENVVQLLVVAVELEMDEVDADTRIYNLLEGLPHFELHDLLSVLVDGADHMPHFGHLAVGALAVEVNLLVELAVDHLVVLNPLDVKALLEIWWHSGVRSFFQLVLWHFTDVVLGLVQWLLTLLQPTLIRELVASLAVLFRISVVVL